MNLSRTLTIAAVTAIAAAPTQSAFGGRNAAPAASSAAGTFRMVGEPKNEPPFTSRVDARGTAGIAPAGATSFRMVGEPKNEPPFTNRVEARGTAGIAAAGATSFRMVGEPKNEPPFTNRLRAHQASRELAGASLVEEFRLMWRATTMSTPYSPAAAPDALERYLRTNAR